MKKLTVLLLWMICSGQIFSQTKFEPGYYVDSNGNKVTGLIKNVGWKNTPQQFIFKISTDEKQQDLLTSEIQEVGINEKVKFQKFAVEIDRSYKLDELTVSQHKAIFEKDTLFLEVLVEGDASLYFYQESRFNRFFYKNKNEPITQLVHKQYRIDDKIGTNNRFRQQLKNNFNCTENPQNVESLSYSKKALIKYFEKYYECKGEEYLAFKKEKRKAVNIGGKVEVMNESFQLFNRNRGPGGEVTKFDHEMLLQYGFYVEYVLPFFKDRWILRIEPSFQKIEKETEDLLFESRSIEVPVGIKYLVLNTDHKINISCYYLMDWSSKTELYYNRNLGPSLTSNTVLGNFAPGVGYEYNRFGLDIRYKFGKDLLGDYTRSRTVLRGMSASFFVRFY